MNVFLFTRIRLTIWYVTAVMVVSTIFSVVIYAGVSHNIEQSFVRTAQQIRGVQEHELLQQFFTQATQETDSATQVPTIKTKHELQQFFLTELQHAKQRVLYYLVLANISIFLASILAGFLLASKTLEPVEAILAKQKRFIADASHELRTPLTSLKTAIEIALRDTTLQSSAKKILNSNLEDVQSLSNLIDNLLRLATQEKPELSRQLIDIHEVLSRALKVIQPFAKEKNITIRTTLAHQQIWGSETDLLQLITILLDNAVKYSNENGVISVQVLLHKKNLVLIVSDTGIGIQKKYLPHIFDRFYRVNQSRTGHQRAGFGLGLSVAKQIVLNHNGTLCVTSAIGSGTVFRITLPIE